MCIQVLTEFLATVGILHFGYWVPEYALSMVGSRNCRDCRRGRGAVAFPLVGIPRCPDHRRPAGVRLDATYAALSGLGNGPKLRLESCSRWPERSNCGQECLSQLEEAPQACLVRNI